METLLLHSGFRRGSRRSWKLRLAAPILAIFASQSAGQQTLDLTADVTSGPLVIKTEALRYGLRGSAPLRVVTDTLRYGAPTSNPTVIKTPPLRYGVQAQSVPTIRTETLRYGVASPSTRKTIRTDTLRYGVPSGNVATIRTETLRYGVPLKDPRRIRTDTLRYGVASDSIQTISTEALRYGVSSGNPLTVQTDTLRYGVFQGESAGRDVEFRLVRVMPLDPNNAIDPFDYRDVISTINEVTTPDTGTPPPPNPEPGPGPEPAAISFTGVPVDFVFSASLNFVPSADPQQWAVAQGPDNTTGTDAAFGFWAEGFVSGGFELQFQTGSGWTSPSLPQTIFLASENFGFETRTVSFDLTRTSDGRRFSVTADVSAGSDGDISVSSASGFDCFTSTGGCP